MVTMGIPRKNARLEDDTVGSAGLIDSIFMATFLGSSYATTIGSE